MVFWTARILRAHDHEARKMRAVRKTMILAKVHRK
jgi:hypothetical protein